MTSVGTPSPCRGSLSSDSQSPCCSCLAANTTVGLTGTGSHRTMGPLLRLGHDNFAYHCGPGRDARLDHDHPQKGLHCVGLMFMRFAMALLVRPCSRYSNTSCSRRV